MPPDPAVVEYLCRSMLDPSVSLPLRFRMLFSLRGAGGDRAIQALVAGLHDTSALFRHEVAFALGQMQTPQAIPALRATLDDTAEHPMVRHEAAEALGAINAEGCEEALERYAADECREVADTCRLALGRIRYWRDKRAAASADAGQQPADGAAAAAGALGSRKEQFAAAVGTAMGGEAASGAAEEEEGESRFLSVDPVPPADAGTPVSELEAALLRDEEGMFERYRALFALRNRSSSKRVAQLLGDVLKQSSSALLKHEACYVLGQLQEFGSVPVLEEILADASQHAMVRHEAAEALGSIAGKRSRPLLEKFAQDEDAVVAEGCAVGLDLMDFELSGQLDYCIMSIPAGEAAKAGGAAATIEAPA